MDNDLMLTYLVCLKVCHHLSERHLKKRKGFVFAICSKQLLLNT